MVKFTHMFVMSILIFWLAVSGCVGNDTDAEEAGLAPEIPGTDAGENSSAGQEELTEADVHEFEKNVTDLEALLENSTEEIVIEEL